MLLNLCKHLLLLTLLFPLLFTRQASQWTCESAKSLDESPIVVGEAQELLDFFNCRRSWPFLHHLDLARVHLNLVMGNNGTEVFHFQLLKKALFWLGK